MGLCNYSDRLTILPKRFIYFNPVVDILLKNLLNYDIACNCLSKI